MVRIASSLRLPAIAHAGRWHHEGQRNHENPGGSPRVKPDRQFERGLDENDWADNTIGIRHGKQEKSQHETRGAKGILGQWPENTKVLR